LRRTIVLKPATFIINTESMARLKKVADGRDLSVSAVLRIAVAEYVRRNLLPSERA
jgi:hypothetical protein